MEQSSSLEHESQHQVAEVLDDRTDSLPVVTSDNDEQREQTEEIDDEEVKEVDEPTARSGEEEHSITDSIVQITKSQVLASEQEAEAHTNPEFITSSNEHMIESTYQEDEKTDDLEQKSDDEAKDEKADEEVESEAETKEDDAGQDQGQKEEEVTEAEKIIDVLENTEELKSQIVELQQSLITSVDLVRIRSTSKLTPWHMF